MLRIKSGQEKIQLERCSKDKVINYETLVDLEIWLINLFTVISVGQDSDFHLSVNNDNSQGSTCE